jgi:RNA polymerase sigma-70 factor (ECF subfamily)
MERVRESSPAAEREKEKWPQTVGEFEAMLEKFQDRLVRYAFHRLSNREDAEEVVQEVFTRAFAGRDEFAKVNRVSPYLFRMAANLCTDFLRKRNPAQLPLDAIDVETIPANSADSPQSVPRAIEQRQIELLLLRLPNGSLRSFASGSLGNCVLMR